MNHPRNTAQLGWLTILLLGAMLTFSKAAQAQTCLTTEDMDPATKTALLTTGQRFFDMAAKGDSATLRQNAIPSLAADFSGIETAIKDNQPNLSNAKATPRLPFLLKAEGTAPLDRAEFLCGVFGPNGQTATSSEFVIPNLPPGNYAIVILDVAPAKGAYTVSFVLQQSGTDWKLGGFYAKSTQIAGHDGDWFVSRAREFKAKGQFHNAWFYLVEARDLLVPVPFMYTQKTDKLYDESQAVKPSDLPADGTTSDLVAAGKTYKLTALFPLTVASDLDLVVKYQSADVSNTTQTFAENMVVIRALVTKYPEFHEAFDGVVARAVEPSGRDYGSLLPMKEIK
ncbi:MAG: hypothetical protein WB421_21250 [Terriglobales bacterium]